MTGTVPGKPTLDASHQALKATGHGLMAFHRVFIGWSVFMALSSVSVPALLPGAPRTAYRASWQAMW